jgi:hypothetical protein
MGEDKGEGEIPVRLTASRWRRENYGEVSELADEHDLGSCAARRGGSSPPFPTFEECYPVRLMVSSRIFVITAIIVPLAFSLLQLNCSRLNVIFL